MITKSKSLIKSYFLQALNGIKIVFITRNRKKDLLGLVVTFARTNRVRDSSAANDRSHPCYLFRDKTVRSIRGENRKIRAKNV